MKIFAGIAIVLWFARAWLGITMQASVRCGRISELFRDLTLMALAWAAALFAAFALVAA